MPYSKQELITLYSLDEDEVNQTLTAAEISVDSEPYTDEQIKTGFELIRSYFNSGQVSDYVAAAELFKQRQATEHLEGKPQAKAKKKALGNKLASQEESNAQEGDRLNVLQLIAQASEHCGVKIELLEAIQIMPSCGLLPNQSEFTQDECDRFLEACELVRNQNKSYAEAAATNSSNALIEEINEYLDIASSAQAEQIRLMLPRLAVEQLLEIKASTLR